MYKPNTLTSWPYIHICLFDPWCWKMLRENGAPMRVYRRGDKFWDIPLINRYAERKSRKLWDDAEEHICIPGNPDCDANLFYSDPKNLEADTSVPPVRVTPEEFPRRHR